MTGTQPPPGAQPAFTMATKDDIAGRAARRGLATAVVTCLAGAGLALLAVTRTWATSVQRQAAPLPDKLVDHTGASLIGWLPALALVGLAGAGALLATRAHWRRATGVLVLLVGLGVVAGAVDGLRIAAGAWPVFVGVGGLAIAWAGLAAVQSGATWPAMGSRYERPAAPTPAEGATSECGAAEGGQTEGVPSADPAATDGALDATAAGVRRTPASMWDDLDRGVDPTGHGD
ncbi:MAG TPA: Trp biosynthesis-associated membrane protein [Micromonosporaceae bacterium]|jgi:hypothetical protein|nr:Trp biosynthesis-associated membrane protein [Micromonosporaceae bacterium]